MRTERLDRGSADSRCATGDENTPAIERAHREAASNAVFPSTRPAIATSFSAEFDLFDGSTVFEDTRSRVLQIGVLAVSSAPATSAGSGVLVTLPAGAAQRGPMSRASPLGSGPTPAARPVLARPMKPFGDRAETGRPIRTQTGNDRSAGDRDDPAATGISVRGRKSLWFAQLQRLAVQGECTTPLTGTKHFYQFASCPVPLSQQGSICGRVALCHASPSGVFGGNHGRSSTGEGTC
jgi:hypothetical protein